MTIKKRLFCSNILMIAVPAVIAALVGLLCLVLLWVTLRSGGGMRLEDEEEGVSWDGLTMHASARNGC